MKYAKWMDKEDLKNNLTKVTIEDNINKSGLPYTYDEDSLYLSDKEDHTLVVGSTGSGKTQSTILPLLKLSLLANENVLINDPLGELYKLTAGLYKDKGYEVILLNYNDLSKGNNYNVLTLPFNLYKNGQKDEAYDLLHEISYYIMYEKNDVSGDPFWINSAIDYFIGLTLYLFDNNEKEVTLNDVFELSEKFNKKTEDGSVGKEILNTLDKTSKSYIYLASIINAPVETKGGIVTVFSQKLRYLISRENLSSAMRMSDFDLRNLVKKKNIVYIVGNEKKYAQNLSSAFISQYIYCNINYADNNIRKNIILDEFEEIIPIKDLPTLLNKLRHYNIKVTLTIKGFKDLENSYGKELSEALKINMGTIIYLLSNEIETLNEISLLCGRTDETTPLVTPEELKLFEQYEAIILKVRWLPVRTKLIPDYEIKWNFSNKEINMDERKC